MRLRTSGWGQLNGLLGQGLRVGRKIFPRAAYRLSLSLFTERCRHMGLEQGKLALTFDCDYAEDSAAADSVRELLQRHNIRTSWAVIGEWVRRFPDVYRRLIDSGHELLNHTLTHPNNEVLRPRDSRRFSEVSVHERREEIVGCHRVIEDLLGYEMRGFRAPHFSMTADVYRILADNGYIYSSSRLYNVGPFVGGLHLTREGIAELPLWGPPVAPFLVPATYFLYRAPIRLYRNERDFYEQFKALLKMSSRRNLAMVVYFDPCDVVQLKEPSFETYLKAALDSGLQLSRMDEIALWLHERCRQSRDSRMRGNVKTEAELPR